MKIKIQFGILAHLGVTNDHYLQEMDRLKLYWKKIDSHNYLKPMNRDGYGSVEDMIYDFTKAVSDDAKWVKTFDGPMSRTNFHLVCYIIDKDGTIVSMEKIKELFY